MVNKHTQTPYMGRGFHHEPVGYIPQWHEGKYSRGSAGDMHKRKGKEHGDQIEDQWKEGQHTEGEQNGKT